MNVLLSITGLVAVHVVANVVWIGAILSVSMLVARAPFMASPEDAGFLGRRVYTRLAVPAFLVSFATGSVRFVLTAGAYAHMPWMHAKLTCALVVIGLHHAIGGRARRVAGGNEAAARGVGALGLVLFVFASCAAVLGVLKSFP